MKGGQEGGSSCQRQRRSGMAPILVLILVVCNRGGGNVVLSPTGSHRHRASATVPTRTYVQQCTESTTLSYPCLPANVCTANLVRLTQNQVRNCPIVRDVAQRLVLFTRMDSTTSMRCREDSTSRYYRGRTFIHDW